MQRGHQKVTVTSSIRFAACLVLLGCPLATVGRYKSEHGSSSSRAYRTNRLVGPDANGLKTIHLAGIFPINGVEGWQGGQVGDKSLRITEASLAEFRIAKAESLDWLLFSL